MKTYKMGSTNKSLEFNGGMYEFNLIKDAVEKTEIENDDIVVLVNGYCEDDKIECDMFSDKKIIFIITDDFAFKVNKNIIEKADYILHQSLNCIKWIPLDKQQFSYVPFLFYKEQENVEYYENNLIIFGGGESGRRPEFLEYLYDSEGKIKNCVHAYTKREIALDMYNKQIIDNRLSYREFQETMKRYNYALMIHRQSYRRNFLNWITPRYIEAINNKCVPIEDINYVSYFKDGYVCRDYKQMIEIKEYLDKNKTECEEYIKRRSEQIEFKKDMFGYIIKGICEVI